MIDLHNHTLPAVDDGAVDMEESTSIARQFVSEGVERIAVTPHLDPENGRGIHADAVRVAVSELREALEAASVPLSVDVGQEIFLTPDLPALLSKGMAIPLGGGRAVLIELSLLATSRPLFLDDTVYRLQLDGFVPVLAHPERYGFVLRDASALDNLLERGLLLQVTAPSLLGHYGPAVRRVAEHLLARGLFALAASDRHHPDQPRSLAVLHDRITRLADSDTADILLRVNPGRLLDGKEPIIVPSHEQGERSLLARILGRN